MYQLISVPNCEDAHWILYVTGRRFHHGFDNLDGAQVHQRIILTPLGEAIISKSYLVGL